MRKIDDEIQALLLEHRGDIRSILKDNHRLDLLYALSSQRELLLEWYDFEPEAEVGTVSIASFNNIVEPPQWKDWSGKVVWPNYKLGVWDPVKWVKFMEYFRAMEQTAPATYKGMVDMYGPNLENVQYGWMDEYNYAATKYLSLIHI